MTCTLLTVLIALLTGAPLECDETAGLVAPLLLARAEQPAEPEPEPEPARSVWDDLADCESGDWIDNGTAFAEGSARWHLNGTDDRAQPLEAWHHTIFYGGVQFTLESWAWAADVGGHDVNPNPANNSREQQIAVAETLLELQGWSAWPVCSQKLELR